MEYETATPGEHRLRLAQSQTVTTGSIALVGLASVLAVVAGGRSLWPVPPPVSPTGASGANAFGMSTQDFVLVLLCVAITVNGCLVGLLLPHFLLAGESHRAARARGENPTGRGERIRLVPAKVFSTAATIRSGAFAFVGVFGAILVLMLSSVFPGLAACCVALVLLSMTFPTTERYRRLVLDGGAPEG